LIDESNTFAGWKQWLVASVKKHNPEIRLKFLDLHAQGWL
jgi:hypothetical protein